MTTCGNHASGSFYTAGLPTVRAAADLYADLAVPPRWTEDERNLDHCHRRICVVRLSNYFKPGARHIKFAEGFLMFLHKGYEGRGRLVTDHQRRIREFAAERAAGTLLDLSDEAGPHAPRVHMTRKAMGTNNSASSAVLLGMAGMGKTLTTEEILNGVPEVIEHTAPVTMKQVVWLKLDCPHKGSVRALCIDFFAEMDRILGTSYKRQYASSRATEESMMSDMALVANLHALGVLVIDEIQHLGRVREDNDVLLKFLVTLINKIGVPVLLVGTTAATDIVRKTLRLGRRSVGLGSASWDRYDRADADWNEFVDDLWSYQWTDVETPLDDALREVFYDETQGIVDLAVKLYILAQMRAIRRGESGGNERITPAIVRRVASEDLAIVRPLIDALRSGDRRRIEKYGDMSSLRDEFTKVLEAQLGRPGFALPAPTPGHRGTRAEGEAEMSDDDRFLQQVFRQLGIGDDVGSRMVEDVRQDEPGADVWRIADLLRADRGAPKRKPRIAAAKAPAVPMQADDMRAIVAAGGADGLSAYASLANAGLAGPQTFFRTV
ncbi:ATP-binding protein [Sphingomonas trueperi]|uniref:ATP-binding protein n=1 Tax=Sphingomonas trueperi TaxID=53317 RepID=UPI000EAB5A62